MLNFTVGPVMSDKEVLDIGAMHVPYFRTPEFSDVMLDNERFMKKFVHAENDARVVFITGSGTASMEACVINLLTPKDKALVIDGGSFGHRFVEMLEIHGIPYVTVVPEQGHSVTYDQLSAFSGAGITSLLVNIDETSVGVLYDIEIISKFCKENDIFLIVDAISSFLCDNIDMKKHYIGALITGSQKALACPPGVSVIVLSKIAVDRVYAGKTKCMYLDLKLALDNGIRGQTPFTPAVGILLQIHERFKMIEARGGVESEIKRIGGLANYFRAGIAARNLPLRIMSSSLSNAVTPVSPVNDISAYNVFNILKDEYGLWVCPNGGELKDKLFRVGHIGALSEKDFDILLDALSNMKENGKL